MISLIDILIRKAKDPLIEIINGSFAFIFAHQDNHINHSPNS